MPRLTLADRLYGDMMEDAAERLEAIFDAAERGRQALPPEPLCRCGHRVLYDHDSDHGRCKIIDCRCRKCKRITT